VVRQLVPTPAVLPEVIAAIEALLEKAGAIRVETLEMAYLTAMSLSKSRTFTGKRVGVVTNAGGPGILITDRLAMHGFELPLLPGTKRDALASVLFPEASTANPIDLVAPAPPEHYAKALEVMAESGMYDALAVICVPPATIDTGKIAEAWSRLLRHLICRRFAALLGRLWALRLGRC
jgi:acetate---CoA ligase (ADP-forming)